MFLGEALKHETSSSGVLPDKSPLFDDFAKNLNHGCEML